jgi:hypothetical protein
VQKRLTKALQECDIYQPRVEVLNQSPSDHRIVEDIPMGAIPSDAGFVIDHSITLETLPAAFIDVASESFDETPSFLKADRMNDSFDTVSEFCSCSETTANEINQTRDSDSKFDVLKMKEDLRSWAVTCHIPLTSLTKLLKILKHVPSLGDLPQDARTLLHTSFSWLHQHCWR